MLENCCRASALAGKSVSAENIDALSEQVRKSMLAADKALAYYRSAAALKRGIEAEGIFRMPASFSMKAEALEAEIAVLIEQYHTVSAVVVRKLEDSMAGYRKRLSSYSMLKNNIEAADPSSYIYPPEMLDISV